MFGFKRKSLYDERHYADFISAMKEAKSFMMEKPDIYGRFALAVFFAAMADTFEIDSPAFNRRKVAKACGFLKGE